MIDGFLLRAIILALILAISAGPISCFIMWRRLAYFSDSLAHSSIIGVMIALLLGFNAEFGVILSAICFAILFALLDEKIDCSRSHLLAILAQGSLALATIIAAIHQELRGNLWAYLFGDIFIVNNQDLITITIVMIAIIIFFVLTWKGLIIFIINEELAALYNIRTKILKTLSTLFIAILIGFAIKVVGALLISTVLIVPAMIASKLKLLPVCTVIATSIASFVIMALGILFAYNFNTPSGATIAITGISVLGLMTLLNFKNR